MAEIKIIAIIRRWKRRSDALWTAILRFQGGTIKLLVNLLDIDRKKDDQRMISEEVNDTVLEHMMAGIEIISGKRGSLYIGVSSKDTYCNSQAAEVYLVGHTLEKPTYFQHQLTVLADNLEFLNEGILWHKFLLS